MRRFVLGWKKLGHEKRLQARIVNYADDLVICCRGRAEEALAIMRDIMRKLKLTVNETKTRVCTLPEEKFDFLGCTFGRCYWLKTGRMYIGTVPSKKRVIRICEAISELTGRDQLLLDQEMVVPKLNRTMIGRWKSTPAKGCVSGNGLAREAPATNGPETDRPHLIHRVTPRLHKLILSKTGGKL
jgi:RNA-directed DNA polymerase